MRPKTLLITVAAFFLTGCSISVLSPSSPASDIRTSGEAGKEAPGDELIEFNGISKRKSELSEVDKQGRILLPAVLRDFAGIDKDAVLVGVGSRIEIWSKDAWNQSNTYDDMEEIAENMEGLGI